MIKNSTPATRIWQVADRPVRGDADYVLYWCIAYRRTSWNFSLDRAIDWSRELGKPLVVLEALRSGYRWASDRLHTFIVQGMIDNASVYEKHGVTYYPYLESAPGEGRGLFHELSKNAAVVISDDYPCSFLPRMVAAAARDCPVRMEVVDSNGLLPMRAADRVYKRAHSFRRFMQQSLADHVGDTPRRQPFRRLHEGRVQLPTSMTTRWAPMAINGRPVQEMIAEIPLDHSVGAVSLGGGATQARKALDTFIPSGLDKYGERRNHPDDDATSGLSPYLHFGHISVHEIFDRIAANQSWSPADINERKVGSRNGWWGLPESIEGFLDELITWREIGFNACEHDPLYDRFESLPSWAQETLQQHARDARPYCYPLYALERANTHDALWNAAQRQLLREGRIHNYLRMLWGKKILEWTASPEQALDVMVHLNNKYAIDGRDPNSYSGIFWVLGRYDRPWGPERPIFGKVRYMSSESTMRKLRVKAYLERYAATGSPFQASFFDTSDTPR